MQRLLKTRKTVLVIVLIAIVAFAGVLLVESATQNNSSPNSYVGVSYGGNSVSEGKQLIDKVKGYTNLFVLQSGSLQRNFGAVDELGDYAVSSGLYFLPYFGNYVESSFSDWLSSAKQRWGNHFLGVYYGDELGGKMLDDYVEYSDISTGDSISKTRYGDVVVEKTGGLTIHYELNGKINLYEPTSDGEGKYSTYYPNGTVTFKQPGTTASTTYQKLASERPFKTNNEAAERFLARNVKEIGFLNQSTTVFSSDYALHWFDYQAGYDVMLTQVGWNISLNQQLALCRGAANAQGKDWGAVITWKYNQSPYLDSGPEIYNQLKTSYECGAKYLVLFNFYEEGKTDPYGTLKDEHFKALEDFWNNVVKNPQVVHGGVKADSVLVLPKNFGGGMRWREDIVWGVFKANESSCKIYDLTQSSLGSYGYGLDIVYDDPSYPLSSGYVNVVRFQT